MPVDVQELDCDFLVASGHKMLGKHHRVLLYARPALHRGCSLDPVGPTGLGFLYAKLSILEEMPPYQGGGEMIDEVFLDHSTFAPPPARFEAGTPAIAEVRCVRARRDAEGSGC
eukprot:1208093-Prorocentrum_lima.AAC.1